MTECGLWVVQEVSVLQPLMHAFKFLNQSDVLVGEVARAASALWGKDDPVAVLGACHVLWLLGYRTNGESPAKERLQPGIHLSGFHLWLTCVSASGRGHQQATQHMAGLKEKVAATEPSEEDPNCDTIQAIKSMPLFAPPQPVAVVAA